MIRAWAATGILWAVSSAALGQALAPYALQVDVEGNQILEPGETASAVPTWWNPGPIALGGVGYFQNFAGPAPATYTIVDGSAFYGAILPGGTGSCPPNCYSVLVTAAARPVLHWDATVFELMTGTHTWTLHIGATFTDVPPSSGFYRFVETIVHKDVTAGCSPTAYCPAAPVSREAMAVFLLVAREPRGYAPAPCGTTPLFSDVPVSSPFCPWVEELARRAIAGGCGGGLYCPAAPVSRQEMAVFLLAGGTTPPPCSAAPFLDVPIASPYCRWIRDLVAMGVTTGCGNGNYCPAAAVTREQMSVFLTTRFALILYGV